MNFLDRAVAAIAPQAGLRRARARVGIQAATMSYEAASIGNRTGHYRAPSTDADAAARQRAKLSFVSRDMIRNSPLAARAQMVITNAVVGDGIIPKITFPALTGDRRKRREEQALRFIEQALDTVEIDTAGRCNLYGLQRLVMQAIIADGEVLVVQDDVPLQERRTARGPVVLPMRLRVLEIDHLDTTREGRLPDGHYIREGIEYDTVGRRAAYWLYDMHPGADGFKGIGWRGQSTRHQADRVLHLYRVDRPGQERGVTWFAPVAVTLNDMADYQDAQIVRQRVAAAFSVFRIYPDAPTDAQKASASADVATLSPGAIYDLYNSEDVKFADPPGVDGYGEFMREGLRAVAAGLGITYEALTGDLTGVNWASYRVGYQTMERNVSSWQWTMMIPGLLQPLASPLLLAWAGIDGTRDTQLAIDLRDAEVQWTPPARFIVDPSRELATLRDAVRSGFTSRQAVIRGMGQDPERVMEEQRADKLAAGDMVFDTDASLVSAGGLAQPVPPQQDNGTGEAENG